MKQRKGYKAMMNFSANILPERSNISTISFICSAKKRDHESLFRREREKASQNITNELKKNIQTN